MCMWLGGGRRERTGSHVQPHHGTSETERSCTEEGRSPPDPGIPPRLCPEQVCACRLPWV